MTTFNLRALATSLACASVALAGLVSPALAQEADRTTFLREGESETFTGYFLKDEVITAVCDEDCSDLDLFLYSEIGAMLDSDEELDAYPVLIAPYEGEFSVEVSMPSCSYSAGCSASISSEYGF